MALLSQYFFNVENLKPKLLWLVSIFKKYFILFSTTEFFSGSLKLINLDISLLLLIFFYAWKNNIFIFTFGRFLGIYEQ